MSDWKEQIDVAHAALVAHGEPLSAGDLARLIGDDMRINDAKLCIQRLHRAGRVMPMRGSIPQSWLGIADAAGKSAAA